MTMSHGTYVKESLDICVLVAVHMWMQDSLCACVCVCVCVCVIRYVCISRGIYVDAG